MLGLKRGTVQLLPHNEEWLLLFEDEKQSLKEALGEIILAIEHIGSTAIPNIPAKPIIDIALGVESLAEALAVNDVFEAMGYTYRPASTNTNELLYVKGSEEKRSHYLHVMVHRSQQWQELKCFRDHLRSNAELAREYASLKELLAAKHPDNRGEYTKGKTDFIQRVLESCKG
jgi:GrpB-like predicted nucleotidyltransferase (UPF0157 family)